MKIKKPWLQRHTEPCAKSRPAAAIYRYAELDDAPLIIDFELQLAQQDEIDRMLRHIAAVIDFDLACVTRGLDPRTRGEG